MLRTTLPNLTLGQPLDAFGIARGEVTAMLAASLLAILPGRQAVEVDDCRPCCRCGCLRASLDASGNASIHDRLELAHAHFLGAVLTELRHKKGGSDCGYGEVSTGQKSD